jgi:formylglycine-generating enzyme required for sulfatase activity/DNA-binding winged helix-turn-helix (wHTH) protein
MAWRIDDYVVDPEAYEVRRAGTLVPVEPQVFDLLVLLIANRQRALGKDEIIERIWEGRIVSDATLSSRIRTARQALGDDGSAQRLVRTIHGRGFRFVGDVEEIGPGVASGGPHNGIHAPGPGAGSVASDVLPKTDVMLAAGDDPAVLLPGRRGWTATPALAAAVAVLAGLYLFSRAAGWSRVSTPQPERISVSVAPQALRPAFKDCETCPEMVVLPEGFFMMGGAPADKRRWNVELPQHLVRIPKQFAIGKFEVTFDEFAAFVDATGHQPAARCNVLVLDLDRWVGKDTTFRDPHYPQTGTHPASCVNWLDAKAYAAWLSQKTGKPYRLPTEAEWEYAARAGTTTPLSFGDYTHARACDHAKFADASTRFAWRDQSCSSDFGHGAAPVGQHRANAWGLHDMHGNVWEWVEDCWHASYDGAPADGTAWLDDGQGGCTHRVTRGGSWRNAIQDLRVTARLRYPPAHAAQVRGFRVALSVDGP